jgi:hypothetical protein
MDSETYASFLKDTIKGIKKQYPSLPKISKVLKLMLAPAIDERPDFFQL